MRTITVPTISSQTTSNPIPLDWRGGYTKVGVQIKQSGTSTTKIQVTQDDVYAAGWTAASANWSDCPTAGLVGATGALVIGSFDMPFTACRVNVTAYTNGNIDVRIVEGSNIGA